jgi:hypothetical protein
MQGSQLAHRAHTNPTEGRVNEGRWLQESSGVNCTQPLAHTVFEPEVDHLLYKLLSLTPECMIFEA